MQEQTLKLGDQTITVTDVKRLDQNRPVYRLEIEPVNNLLSTVIIKQQKEGWSDEFEKDASSNGRLKDLQGDKIPNFSAKVISMESGRWYSRRLSAPVFLISLAVRSLSTRKRRRINSHWCSNLYLPAEPYIGIKSWVISCIATTEHLTQVK